MPRAAIAARRIVGREKQEDAPARLVADEGRLLGRGSAPAAARVRRTRAPARAGTDPRQGRSSDFSVNQAIASWSVADDEGDMGERGHEIDSPPLAGRTAVHGSQPFSPSFAVTGCSAPRTGAGPRRQRGTRRRPGAESKPAWARSSSSWTGITSAGSSTPSPTVTRTQAPEERGFVRAGIRYRRMLAPIAHEPATGLRHVRRHHLDGARRHHGRWATSSSPSAMPSMNGHEPGFAAFGRVVGQDVVRRILAADRGQCRQRCHARADARAGAGTSVRRVD